MSLGWIRLVWKLPKSLDAGALAVYRIWRGKTSVQESGAGLVCDKNFQQENSQKGLMNTAQRVAKCVAVFARTHMALHDTKEIHETNTTNRCAAAQ